MIVKCECGQEFNLEMPRLFYAPEHKNPTAGQKCPNPQCNKAIYVEVNVNARKANTQHIQDNKINWHNSKVGDILYFTGFPYEIAFKEVRRIRDNVIANAPIPILYLRSLSGMDNMVVEVKMNKSLVLMHVYADIDENINESPWYETWTEDQLRRIFDERAGL